MRDKVSIITPTYNCGLYIKETIESVISQTYVNWELLIVDDCSTDNTKAIVTKYLEQDNRIQYHCLDKNSGAAVARNYALKIATGRWIAFLDSDDLWNPDKLERQVTYMIDNNYSFTYTNYCIIDEQSDELGIEITGPKHITRHGMYNYCWPGCLTVMYDANVVGLIQINPIRKNNDYAIWLKVVEKSDCYLLNYNLAKYRKRKGSISNHAYISLIKWHYTLFNKTVGLNPVLSITNVVRNIFFGVLKKIRYVKNNNTSC